MSAAAKHTPGPRLVYPDKPVPLRWGVPLLGNPSAGRGLREMCDFGADQFVRGVTDLVAFDCMPAEVETIRAYMAKHHPSVSYTFGSGQAVISHARAAIAKATGVQS